MNVGPPVGSLVAGLAVIRSGKQNGCMVCCHGMLYRQPKLKGQISSEAFDARLANDPIFHGITTYLVCSLWITWGIERYSSSGCQPHQHGKGLRGTSMDAAKEGSCVRTWLAKTTLPA